MVTSVTFRGKEIIICCAFLTVRFFFSSFLSLDRQLT